MLQPRAAGEVAAAATTAAAAAASSRETARRVLAAGRGGEGRQRVRQRRTARTQRSSAVARPCAGRATHAGWTATSARQRQRHEPAPLAWCGTLPHPEHGVVQRDGVLRHHQLQRPLHLKRLPPTRAARSPVSLTADHGACVRSGERTNRRPCHASAARSLSSREDWNAQSRTRTHACVASSSMDSAVPPLAPLARSDAARDGGAAAASGGTLAAAVNPIHTPTPVSSTSRDLRGQLSTGRAYCSRGAVRQRAVARHGAAVRTWGSSTNTARR